MSYFPYTIYVADDLSLMEAREAIYHDFGETFFNQRIEVLDVCLESMQKVFPAYAGVSHMQKNIGA